MRPTRMMIRCFPACAILSLMVLAKPASAQVREVVVGITTTCPYENAIEGSCWSGAYWALSDLEGIKSVDKSANGYACTARVYLRETGLPDPNKWASQFKSKVDQAYVFRGVEVTVVGSVANVDNRLVLQVRGANESLTLRPLEHKLQWNSKKGTARQPEPDERDAYQQLRSKTKDAKEGRLNVTVTGPLMKSDQAYTLEVREFFSPTDDTVDRSKG
jgi:hypothetical protein